jgi:hypothetical protein
MKMTERVPSFHMYMVLSIDDEYHLFHLFPIFFLKIISRNDSFDQICGGNSRSAWNNFQFIHTLSIAIIFVNAIFAPVTSMCDKIKIMTFNKSCISGEWCLHHFISEARCAKSLSAQLIVQCRSSLVQHNSLVRADSYNEVNGFAKLRSDSSEIIHVSYTSS